jgi:hypothetical protein
MQPTGNLGFGNADTMEPPDLSSLAHLRHFAIQSCDNLLIPHSAESFCAET